VVIKKQQKEGDLWSDLASTYAITVEPMLGGGSLGAAMHGGSSEVLSDYEVPVDTAW